MSHHIVHILHHGSRLSKQRGMLVCKHDDSGAKHELPIEDIRSVIIAARGVSMSLELVSALMESGAVVLHCNHSYKPVGITSGLERVVKSGALFNQANQKLLLHERLWKRVVASKVANQASVLDLHDRNAMFLIRQLQGGPINEAACSRHYWKEYFSLFGLESVLRHGEDSKQINSKLDYGYAVLGALIHRGIVAHGLSPVFGMHHVTRYKAHAMVYDLMEPWRPFVDNMLCDFEDSMTDTEDSMKAWARHVSTNLKNIKLRVNKNKLKAIDAIDVYVSNIAKCYADKTVRFAWMPSL